MHKFLTKSFSATLIITLTLAPMFCVAVLAQQTTEKRAPWTTSKIVGSPDPAPPDRAKRVFPKLQFDRPTVLTSAPGTDRLFVAEHRGKIYSIANNDETQQADLLLDINDAVTALNATGEKVQLVALYGLTFHPKFADNGLFYVCYVVNHADGSKGQHPHGTRVSQFHVKDLPKAADVASEKLIISWLQGGHNGGCLKFGPDGYLYISAGDGGFAFPPDGLSSGQDVSNLLASVSRIDVDNSTGELPYAIPADNPLLKFPGARPEIWAYGMRNPWKMSFDRQTGELWVGDVGWELWEMIYRVRPGDNFGWSLFEGRQPVHQEGRRGPTPITPPAIEIPHTDGASITGGFVYRGKQFPDLVGNYIFGDWETRRIWAAKISGDSVQRYVDILDPTVRIVGFAEDNDGEILLLDYSDGTIHRIEKNAKPRERPPFPTKLSETGLFASAAEHELADGVIPFQINSPLWADGATAQRFIGVPGNESIKLHPNKTQVAGSMFRRQIDFPAGTVLGKTFFAPAGTAPTTLQQRIETQILHFDGLTWRGYSYLWNDEMTDATLAESAGRQLHIKVADGSDGQTSSQLPWTVPSRQQCIRCHNPWAEHALSFNVSQLNRAVHLQPKGDSENQITLFRQIGLIEDVVRLPDMDNPFDKGHLAVSPPDLPQLADPLGDEDINTRARSYLHANCAHCHRDGGGGSAQLHLPVELPLSRTKAFDLRPTQGTFEIANAKILAPGDPYRSMLYLRMAKLGPGRMPHVGSQQVDRAGIKLIHDWIRQLPIRLETSELIQRLIASDETTALAREQEQRAESLWKIAKQIAGDNNREKPTEADQATAERTAKRQAAERARQRTEARERIIDQLLDSPADALVVLAAIHANQIPVSSLEQLVKLSQTNSNPIIVDTFQQFIPLSQRIKRLGEKVAAAEILQIKGDAERGRRLFWENSAISCKSCHRIEKAGHNIGPELTGIAKRLNRNQLLEGILEPSRKIDPKFATWILETSGGKVHVGLLQEKNADHVILLTARNEQVKVESDEIETLQSQRNSLMPQSLVKDLTAGQLADLLSYLETLK